ncbi:MAG: recombination protein NinB [Pseudomonadales bacterium]
MNIVVYNGHDIQKFVTKVLEKLGQDLGGKPYTISIKRFFRPRTLDQNAKFHAMISDIAQHIGYERPEYIKDYVKDAYGYRKTVVIDGKPRSIPMSTADYNVDQFTNIIDRLYQLGAELGVEFQDATDDRTAIRTG